jgi:drug/metabolite transporter (DMT)-like permease
MIAAFAWMTPITLIVEQPLSQSPTLAGLLAIAYLGIFPTGLAMLIFFYLIAQLGVNRFAQVNYIVPVLGALWGMVFLGEPFSWKLAIALGLVLLSINIVRSRPT